MHYVYPCVLTPEEEGGLFVSFPDVPGALTCGDDRAEALAMAEDALAVALTGYVHKRWDIPVPSARGSRAGIGSGPDRPRRQACPLYGHAAPGGHQGRARPPSRPERRGRAQAVQSRPSIPCRQRGKPPCAHSAAASWSPTGPPDPARNTASIGHIRGHGFSSGSGASIAG